MDWCGGDGMRIVNLLDDFNLGGVTKGLSVFEEPEICAVASIETIAIQPDKFRAEEFDADMILTHFPPNWRRLPYLASLKRSNPRARLVHVEHSYTENWFVRKVSHPARFQKMLSFALGQFDDVVCVSNAQRDWLAQFCKMPTSGFRTIYPYGRHPGIDALAPPRFEAAKNLTIGTYGRLHECKGFDRLIRAFLSIGPASGLKLVIGGAGPDEAALKQLAAGAPHIRFVGLVENVADFLSQCDVIAVPSRYEAFGQVALEARRAARPLLVSDIDGLPEQIADCGLIVNCRSQHILKSALSLLKVLPLEYLSQNARLSAKSARAQTVSGWLDLFAGHCLASQAPLREASS
jgi:glycosyltransferase involved in cell wall biosynthesis